MLRIFLIFFLLIFACPVVADENEVFDFSYTIDGKLNRPVVVFNDGSNTYIQVRNQQSLVLATHKASLRLPYYVIHGLPARIEGVSGGEEFQITWAGAHQNTISPEYQRPNADLPERSFSATYGRIAFLNGQPADHGLLNPLPQASELRQILKALAPHAWRGTAERAIDIRQILSIPSVRGESWLLVFNRILENINCYAELDVEQQLLHLRHSPSKGFSLSLDALNQNRTPIRVEGDSAKLLDFHPIESAFAEQSLRAVNIEKIEYKQGVFFLSLRDPKMPMQIFLGNSVIPMKTVLPSSGNSIALPANDTLRIQSHSQVIELKLHKRRIFEFDSENALDLLAVQEDASSTHFRFRSTVQHLQLGAQKSTNINGVWHDAIYSVLGHANEWGLNATGQKVHVAIREEAVIVWRQVKEVP